MLNIINELAVQLIEAEYQASIAGDTRKILHIAEVRRVLLEVERLSNIA